MNLLNLGGAGVLYKEYIAVTFIEEIAEVQQMVAKVLRFGENFENIEKLILEINDMIASLELLMLEFNLPDINVDQVVLKRNKINHWYKKAVKND